MPLSVLFFKYFSNGDELMAYIGQVSLIYVLAAYRSLRENGHSGQQGSKSRCAPLSPSAASGRSNLQDSMKCSLGMSSRIKRWETGLNRFLLGGS